MSEQREATKRSVREERGGVDLDASYDVQSEYGKYVFDDAAMRDRLTRGAYKAVTKARRARTQLSPEMADQVATAMKDWAVGLGATHYTHQFHPLTGKVAEKHDSFIEPNDGQGQKVLMQFSGALLIMGEPDASSFPNGGIRSTHQARGYTAWDMSSNVYVKQGPNGGTLVIPTAFVSWTGEALCNKTPLLRSVDVLSDAAVALLHTLGHTDVSFVEATLGAEQEYFLIDQGFYQNRPDLVMSGRTLFGAPPSHNQQLSDHYFGYIPERVLSYMQDCERQLWQLGMPNKTRHNEVAPGQFETAPVFETASKACDHNMLQMDVMREVAKKHGLECLFHEKPFANINGSGKHNNWSMCTDTGINLFEPKPSDGGDIKSNKIFIASLAACIRAVDLHPEVLRSSIGVHGNDFRLGANEAPPAIMSIFLGSQLDRIVRELMGVDSDNKGTPSKALSSRSKGRQDSFLNIGASALPSLHRDATDRNRTSPFAFTGNKFEFRAVGSTQACAVPLTILNTVQADSMLHLNEEITARIQNGASLDDAFDAVIKETLTKHYRVVFNGDGYSDDWLKEAEKRGLKNLPAVPDALSLLVTEDNVDLFEGVLSKTELEARRNVWIENYNLQADIEAQTAIDLINTRIVPAAQATQTKMAGSLAALKAAGISSDAQTNHLKTLAGNVDKLLAARDNIAALIAKAEKEGDDLKAGFVWAREVGPALLTARDAADAIEGLVDDKDWSLPKYQEMLFLK